VGKTVHLHAGAVTIEVMLVALLNLDLAIISALSYPFTSLS
jgi:hypothetical protein